MLVGVKAVVVIHQVLFDDVTIEAIAYYQYIK
jgi:hypothetical protein